MGMIRTLGLVSAVKGTPTPAVLAAAYYTSTNLATPGVVIAAASFSILNGIATIVLASALPKNGYNGPNGYPVLDSASNAQFDIQGKYPAPNGQQVTLWGFTTATYFNGKRITVLDCNPATNSFRFYFKNANVASTVDAGNTAPSPFQHYRAIRLECSQSLGTDLIFVGDLNVSSTQYMACLSLAGQLSIELAGENIPPEGLFIDTSGTAGTDQVQVTLIS
jgi:hypothetical protein